MVDDPGTGTGLLTSFHHESADRVHLGCETFVLPVCPRGVGDDVALQLVPGEDRMDAAISPLEPSVRPIVLVPVTPPPD